MPKTAPRSTLSPAATPITSTASGSASPSTATTINAARRLRAGANLHPPPRQRGRGTTGAREASEPWWRGRGPHSLLRRLMLASPPAPPPPRFARSPSPASLRYAVADLLIHVRHLDAERCRQIDLVILLLHQAFADLLGHGEFAERLALPDAVAVTANGLVFVVEIEPQHVLGFFRGL